MSKSKFVALAGIIAALYVGLSLVSAAFGLSSGLVQLRLSEALCVLAFFTPAAIPGLFLGCFLTNVITGAVVLDVIAGSLATLAGAIGTYLIGRFLAKKSKQEEKKMGVREAGVLALSLLPPVLANTVVLPLVFTYGYMMEGTFIYFATFILISEFLSAGVVGFLLGLVVDKRLKFLMTLS